jgi:SAM-dependent methyltransferase
MRLSEIVEHKNMLDQLTVSDIAETAGLGLDNIIYNIKQAQLSIEDQLEDLDHSKFVIDNVFFAIENTIEYTQAAVLQAIEQNEKGYFKQSKELYENMCHEEVDYILARTKPMREETQELIDARLKRYTDWKFPGMIIRPAHETHVNNLVALDPLYMVDTHADLLLPALNSFTPEYQARVRLYVVEEYTKAPIFKNFPKNQFGFIFSHNYFQYKPIGILQDYITEIFELLRPGGVFGFTYNDCDHSHAVRLVEKHFHCYTPGRLIKQYALDAGFDIVYEHHAEENIHWLEIQRPGEKESLRGGQSMAAIVPKNNLLKNKKSKYPGLPIAVDNSIEKAYTDDDILKLQMSAVLLGIDTEERIFSVYDPEKLDRLVNLRMNQGGIEIAKFNEKLERKINKRKKS